jgi:hypothetical protein
MKFSLTVFELAFILAIAAGCASPDLSKSGQFDSLTLQGTPQFDEQVEKALALLKTRSPAGYATVTNYIGIIQQNEHSGMDVHHKPPLFQLNDHSASYSVTWCAGVIAHDSYHSKLYFDYKQQHPRALLVPDDIYGGERAERACLEHQISVLKAVGAPASEIAWCQQCETQTNKYWDVRYNQRNW